MEGLDLSSQAENHAAITKIRNLFLADYFSYVSLVIGGLALATLFHFQPKISDDWYLLWKHQGSQNVVDYWIGQYNGWTGRLPLILLSSLIFPNLAIESFYRLFIVVEVVVLIGLAWYCALGKNGFRFDKGNLQAFLLFGMLFWLSLPVRAETVSWLSGNFCYLVPGILGLAFIAWSKYCLSDERAQPVLRWAPTLLKPPIWFLMGFLAGSSQEQIVSACAIFIAVGLHREIIAKNFRKIPIGFWVSVLGFFLGALFLVAAPGNYVRLGKMESASFLEAIERMALFIPSAFFEIGTGNTGKSIWFGIVVLVALFYKDNSSISNNIKSAGTWVLVGLATLFAMLPATNQISPRTTFFAIIFLYIAIASLLFQGNSHSKRPLVSVALIIVSLLVLVEAAAGTISNISVAAEFNRRWAIVHTNHPDQVAVPFIATYPAVLTYIQTPEHDRQFLAALSKHVGFKVIHDVGEKAQLPASFKPLKAIKYHQR